RPVRLSRRLALSLLPRGQMAADGHVRHDLGRALGWIVHLRVDLEERLRHLHELLPRLRRPPYAVDLLEGSKRSEGKVEGGKAADRVAQPVPVEAVESACMDERSQERDV